MTLLDAGPLTAKWPASGPTHGSETAERPAWRLILTGLALPAGIEEVRVRADDTGRSR